MFCRKSARDGGKEKQKTTRATLGVKKEIIAEHENGVCASDSIEVWQAKIDNMNVLEE